MVRKVVKHKNEPTNDFLSGGGEMACLMRTFDWTKTDLGPADGWAQSLKTAVRIMLDSDGGNWLSIVTQRGFFRCVTQVISKKGFSCCGSM